MDSIDTGQLRENTTSVRRVAIIGTPPGLGMAPTLLVSSPRFQAQPKRAPVEPPHVAPVQPPHAAREEQPHAHGLRRHLRAGRSRRPRIRGPLPARA
jgi:hypothetical protein